MLVGCLTSCVHYYPVAVEENSQIDLNRVSKALGYSFSERLASVRVCSGGDATRFGRDLESLAGCVVATTIEKRNCPSEFEYLLWEEDGEYVVSEEVLVSICLT